LYKPYKYIFYFRGVLLKQLCTCKPYYLYLHQGHLHMQTMLLVFTYGHLHMQTILLVFTSRASAHANYTTRIYLRAFAHANYTTCIYHKGICTCRLCYSYLHLSPLHMQTMQLVFTSVTFAPAKQAGKCCINYNSCADNA